MTRRALGSDLAWFALPCSFSVDLPDRSRSWGAPLLDGECDLGGLHEDSHRASFGKLEVVCDFAGD